MHFRAGQGLGLNSLNSTLTGTLNSSTFELTNPDDAAAILAQAWYQIGMPVGGAESGRLGRFEATLGKIDMFGFFDGNDLADDESESFLNNVFVHNPLLDSGGDIGADSYGFAPGMVLAYVNDINSVNHWRFSLGAFGSGPGASYDTSFTQPFVIAQAEYTGRVLRGQPGTWRVYAWNNSRATPFANEADASTERHTGWGLSIDQQMLELRENRARQPGCVQRVRQEVHAMVGRAHRGYRPQPRDRRRAGPLHATRTQCLDQSGL